MENEFFVEGFKDKISFLEIDLVILWIDMLYMDFLYDIEVEEFKRLILKLESSDEEIRCLVELCENII